MTFERAPLNYAELPFGYVQTDANVRYTYRNGSWDAGVEMDKQELPLHIAATALHYGQAVFEGLKVYTTKDDRALLFRPEENAKRFQHSAEMLCMVAPPEELFVEAVERAVRANRRFLPPYGEGATLYVRPLLLGMTARIGVSPADEYLFMVMVTPVGPYFKNGFSSTKLMIEDKFARAMPGGLGTAKAGGNYAAGMRGFVKAKQGGYGEALYLDNSKRFIDELGAGNFFGISEGKRYITPDSQTVLQSITNDSLQTLARDLGYTVEKRPVPVDELFEFIEAGACGTAAVITPVESIAYKGETITYLKDGKPGPHCTKLYNALTHLQSGDAPDPYGWTREVK